MRKENSTLSNLFAYALMALDVGVVIYSIVLGVYASVACLASWPLVPNVVWFAVSVVFIRNAVRWMQMGVRNKEFEL